MTKSQIYNEYNSLTETINRLLNEYKELTGKEWEGTPKTGNMSPSTMMNYKDDLERSLSMRKCTIHSIREKMEIYKSQQELVKSDAGKKFVEELQAKYDSFDDQMDAVRKNMGSKFNSLLSLIGLDEWTVPESELYRMTPTYSRSYFDIFQKSSRWAGVHISINCEKGKFEMKVSCGMRGEEEISSRGEEYQNFKAYVTICEHSDMINGWLDTEYRSMAKKMYDLCDDERKTKEALDDPAAAYARMSA